MCVLLAANGWRPGCRESSHDAQAAPAAKNPAARAAGAEVEKVIERWGSAQTKPRGKGLW